MVKKSGLGRGLEALLPSPAEESSNNSDENGVSGVFELKINEVEPNTDQPRKKFDDDKINQLAQSISQHGVVQPLIVRKDGDVYKIVAGERRWRAARIAGLTKIPVIVKELSDREMMEIALIENIQREDLNAIEEAEAFEKLIKEFQLTQEQLSITVGKSRSAIANSMRLLSLTEDIKKYLVNGDLTSGHARAILSISNKETQNIVAREIIEKDLNVRETERLVKFYLIEKTDKVKVKQENKEEYTEIQERLQNFFGTKVRLMANKNSGKILIEYYSPEELERILDIVDSKAN